MSDCARALSRLAIASTLMLAGCNRVPHRAPPRADDRVTVPVQSSVIAVPVTASLDELSQALDQAVPVKLWSIDKPGQTCVSSQKVKVLFAKIRTPTLKCEIIGQVTRGGMNITGAGSLITVTMPIHATVSARDIGGVVKQETAQADARVRANVRLDLASNWSPRATVDIAYDWNDAPHVDILGQRVEFTSKADEKLRGVIANLERTLPGQLAKLHFRERVAQAWGSAFTSLELNHAAPSVWMRVTPQELDYGGYKIEQGTLTLNLGMKARTETFVGPRPTDPVRTPLPPLRRAERTAGDVLFAIPVIADYHQLEPVLARALTKRAQRPFVIPGIGPVNAQFSKVMMYGTTGEKIAVGLTFTAARPGDSPAKGTIWMTAKPVNTADSQRVSFTDLNVVGVTDSTGASLLIKLANAPGLSSTVADALTQNFSKDYENLLEKVQKAIAEKRQGDLLIRAHITNVKTGQIKAVGQGVYLPIWGTGTASISLYSITNH